MDGWILNTANCCQYYCCDDDDFDVGDRRLVEERASVPAGCVAFEPELHEWGDNPGKKTAKTKCMCRKKDRRRMLLGLEDMWSPR